MYCFGIFLQARTHIRLLGSTSCTFVVPATSTRQYVDRWNYSTAIGNREYSSTHTHTRVHGHWTNVWSHLNELKMLKTFFIRFSLNNIFQYEPYNLKQLQTLLEKFMNFFTPVFVPFEYLFLYQNSVRIVIREINLVATYCVRKAKNSIFYAYFRSLSFWCLFSQSIWNNQTSVPIHIRYFQR